MNTLIKALARTAPFRGDLDYHLVRASMVLVFLLFGYQKWFEYEAQTLIPFIKNGPLIFWMYPLFGIRGASWFLGASEWLFAVLLFWGFWNKKVGILGGIGCAFAMIGTVTIIPFMPDGWDADAGFPAMKGNVAFLMKDWVLLAASFYLLKQDVVRAAFSADEQGQRRDVADSGARAAEQLAATSRWPLEENSVMAAPVIIVTGVSRMFDTEGRVSS